MAARRGTKKAEEPQPTADEAVKDEPQEQDEPSKEAESEKPTKEEEPQPKKSGEMVLVRNKARFDYVQPSTGIKVRVDSREPTKVLNDGWTKQFVDAGLLRYA